MTRPHKVQELKRPRPAQSAPGVQPSAREPRPVAPMDRDPSSYEEVFQRALSKNYRANRRPDERCKPLALDHREM